jgi:hypothetical protein
VLDHDTVTDVPTVVFSDDIENCTVGGGADEGLNVGICTILSSEDEEPPPQPLSELAASAAKQIAFFIIFL